ncbi:hypothetical protein C4K06_4695 [Pseudomonas chlororaphis subsp. aureofaciens]|nr:hypothetical protein C4K06_4695 [Pseudomonas chlororaphis subsp. aureofaciens]
MVTKVPGSYQRKTDNRKDQLPASHLINHFFTKFVEGVPKQGGNVAGAFCNLEG